MKKITILLAIAATMLSFASCKSEQQMIKDAENVLVKCNPSPLCLKGGVVEADLAVTYPDGYFHPKAILEVTPVIVYQGGEVAMEPMMFQGEKVKNNYRVVRKTGSVINQRVSFPYAEGMAKSSLELRSRCSFKKDKWTALPTKKVADGCNITETLADARGTYSLKHHGYQDVITLNPEGQVMYNINSSVVRNSELKSQSIKDFKATLTDMTLNERTAITGIEVVAYASPDGSEKFNDKLSTNRSKSANKAFEKVAKDEELTGVRTSVKSVGEDWEGFQEMVSKSQLEDKDLIIRVLQMYSDPNVREQEIRNMASIYQDLAKDVLPQLRRARFIATVEFTNYDDEELLKLIQENSDVLDEAALLKAATLCKDTKDKKTIYNKAVEKYASKAAAFNLACVALDENKLDEAKKQIEALDAEDPDVVNLKGVCLLREGKRQEALKLFEQSATADAVKNQGLCALLDGRYTDAILKCGTKGRNAAVARILAGRYGDAITALGDCQCAMSNYIRAIAENRKGNVTEAKALLEKATSACDKLAARAKTDIEFVNFLAI